MYLNHFSTFYTSFIACAGDLELLERAPASPVGESCIASKKSALKKAIKLKKALK